MSILCTVSSAGKGFSFHKGKTYNLSEEKAREMVNLGRARFLSEGAQTLTIEHAMIARKGRPRKEN